VCIKRARAGAQCLKFFFFVVVVGDVAKAEILSAFLRKFRSRVSPIVDHFFSQKNLGRSFMFLLIR
jgi:choline kinase